MTNTHFHLKKCEKTKSTSHKTRRKNQLTTLCGSTGKKFLCSLPNEQNRMLKSTVCTLLPQGIDTGIAASWGSELNLKMQTNCICIYFVKSNCDLLDWTVHRKCLFTPSSWCLMTNQDPYGDSIFWESWQNLQWEQQRESWADDDGDKLFLWDTRLTQKAQLNTPARSFLQKKKET